MSPTTVGRSRRTPAKHALMCKLIGREVGAGGKIAERLVWFDLTAGDGVTDEGVRWEQNCSPGILAYYARGSVKPIDVYLSEAKRSTFDELERNLQARLPALDYRRLDDGSWTCGSARLWAAHRDGCDAALDAVTKKTAVLVTHDPNAMNQRAMRPGFIAEVRARTPWFQAISTMGCNPAGLKRLPMEDRRPWFDFVADQQESLPRWHDLTLAAIERDDAQWAYLICHAAEWRGRVIKDCSTSFEPHGMTLDVASLGTEPERFTELQRRLFLTKRERET